MIYEIGRELKVIGVLEVYEESFLRREWWILLNVFDSFIEMSIKGFVLFLVIYKLFVFW